MSDTGHQIPRIVVQDRWLSPVHNGLALVNQTFTADRVLLVQFVVPAPCRIDGLAYTVGTTAAGNVIGGIVGPVTRSAADGDIAGARVLAQSASTAQGLTSKAQVLTWTAVAVRPGIYYAALEGSDATGTYMRQSNMEQAPGLGSYYGRAGGFGALTDPVPATTASSGNAIPGVRVRVAA